MIWQMAQGNAVYVMRIDPVVTEPGHDQVIAGTCRDVVVAGQVDHGLAVAVLQRLVETRQIEEIRSSGQLREIDIKVAGNEVDQLVSGVLDLVEQASHRRLLPRASLALCRFDGARNDDCCRSDRTPSD